MLQIIATMRVSSHREVHLNDYTAKHRNYSDKIINITVTIKNQKPIGRPISQSIDAGENAIRLGSNFGTTIGRDISQQSPREAARAKVNNGSPHDLDLEFQARKSRLIVLVKAIGLGGGLM